MHLRTRTRVLSAAVVTAVVTALAAAAPATGATATGSTAGKLSPRLALLASPSLVHAPAATQADALNLPASGGGSLLRGDSGQILTYVSVTDSSPTGLSALRAAGAQIVDVSPEYGVVTVSIAPDHLTSLASRSQVSYVDEAIAPQVTPLAGSTAPSAKKPPISNCGSVISEGDAILQAAYARHVFGVDGHGVTVGVLSDTFDTAKGVHTHAAQDVKTGDLPGPGNPCGYPAPVRVLKDVKGNGATDEGRAMAQLVHDLAPGARLAFATAFLGEYSFAHYIKQLRDVAGATVIVDDVTYTEDPLWQRGPIGDAVAYVTSKGTTYVSSAGNENVRVNGHDVGSYEAPAFRPTSCPSGLPAKSICHDFDPGPGKDATNGYTVASGGVIWSFVQWAEPRFGVTDNFAYELIDHSTHKVLAIGHDNALKNGKPTQFMQWQNKSNKPRAVDIVIRRLAGSGNPRLEYSFFNAGPWTSVERLTAQSPDIIGRGEIVGHNGDPLAISSAATDWEQDGTPEFFSARGPVTWLFAPVNGKQPSGRLAKPQTFAKPDVTATDGVLTTFFYGPGDPPPYRFYGTSAAAPHIAGIVALLRQIAPGATPSRLRSVVRQTASPMPNGSGVAVGGGLADAYQAGLALRK